MPHGFAVRIALGGVCLTFVAGCGYVGDPLPPALHIPNRVSDLRVLEYGDHLVVEFTVPPLTTEDLPVKDLAPAELTIGPGGNPFNTENWAASANTTALPVSGPGPVHHEVAAAPWIGKDVVAGVRLVNDRGRKSAWSNLVSLRVIPPVPAPLAVQAKATAAGVRLTWQGSESASYRIFRKGPGDDKPSALAETPKSEYVDASANFDQEYVYLVQAIRDKAESEVSVPVSITPKDTFPPATPAGLTVISGVGSIELTWDRDTEPDLRGYRVYRALNGGEFQRVANLVELPAYSDRQIESGKRYRYAVTAVDQLGNESPRSNPAEAVAP